MVRGLPAVPHWSFWLLCHPGPWCEYVCLLWKLPVWVGVPAPPLTVTLQPLATSQSFLNFSALTCMHMCVLSHGPLFGTLRTIARQAPLSTEFSRQEYWSGLPFPPAGDLPDPGINPASPASLALTGRFFTTATWEAPFIQGNKFMHVKCLAQWLHRGSSE